MKKENISYENNPTEYESNLRQNLSSDNHTKESLVNVAVHTAIEAEKKEIELRKYQDIATKEMQSKSLAMQFLNNTKLLELEQIASVLEADFGFIGMAEILRKASGKAKSTLGKKGGKTRAENNKQTQMLKEIEATEYPLKKLTLHITGHTTKFVTDMHVKYPKLARSSIETLVSRLNKENDIRKKS